MRHLPPRFPSSQIRILLLCNCRNSKGILHKVESIDRAYSLIMKGRLLHTELIAHAIAGVLCYGLQLGHWVLGWLRENVDAGQLPHTQQYCSETTESALDTMVVPWGDFPKLLSCFSIGESELIIKSMEQLIVSMEWDWECRSSEPRVKKGTISCKTELYA